VDTRGRKCPECGALVYGSDDRCMSCGIALTKPSQLGRAPGRAAPSGGRGRRARLGLALVLGAAVLVALSVAGIRWSGNRRRANAARLATEQADDARRAARAADAMARGVDLYELGLYDIAKMEFQHAKEDGAQSASEWIAACDQGLAQEARLIGIAQEAVRERLKAPRTACFTGGGLPEPTVTRLDDGSVHVSGYVDAENSFGALLRKWYWVWLSADGTVVAVNMH